MAIITDTIKTIKKVRGVVALLVLFCGVIAVVAIVTTVLLRRKGIQENKLNPDSVVCSAWEYKCVNESRCVELYRRCDGLVDCATDNSDELNCFTLNGSTAVVISYRGSTEYSICYDTWNDSHSNDICKLAGYGNKLKSYWTMTQNSGKFISVNSSYSDIFPISISSFTITNCTSMKALALKCQTDDEKVFFCMETESWIYRNQTCNHLADCPTQEDEFYCACDASYQFGCDDGPCIYKNWTCDGVADCPKGDDEKIAACNKCSSNEFKCLKENRCVELSRRCDGVVDCTTDKSDELNCISIDVSEASDNATTVLVAYRGSSRYFICFDSWDGSYSEQICDSAGYGSLLSSYWTIIPSENKFLSLNYTPTDAFPVSMSSFTVTNCTSMKALTLKCMAKDCGTRRILNNFESVGQYILKGQWAKPGAWPWHAVLISKELCGGSLIDPFWVLTAAHCVYAKLELYNFTGPIRTSDLKVYFGMTSLFNQTQLELSRMVEGKVKAIFVHQDFNFTTAKNDLALIQFTSPIGVSEDGSRDYVEQVCLPNYDVGNAEEFKVCVSTGFGFTESNTISLVLRQSRMNILPDSFCASKLADPSWIDHRTCIGTRPTAGNNNICSGDSGGPFVCSDARGVWTLVGVHSYVVGSGSHLAVKRCQLSFVQRVAYYLPWINETIALN